MEMHRKQRKRSENWGLKEKNFFVQCVSARKDIIDDKGSDERTIRAKCNAWKEIERCMRMRGYNRRIVRMREQWRRIKNGARNNNPHYSKLLKVVNPEHENGKLFTVKEEVEDPLTLSNTDPHPEIIFEQSLLPTGISSMDFVGNLTSYEKQLLLLEQSKHKNQEGRKEQIHAAELEIKELEKQSILRKNALEVEILQLQKEKLQLEINLLKKEKMLKV